MSEDSRPVLTAISRLSSHPLHRFRIKQNGLISGRALNVDEAIKEAQKFSPGTLALPMCANPFPLEVFVGRKVKSFLTIPTDSFPVPVDDLDYFPSWASSAAPNMCLRYLMLKFSHTYSGASLKIEWIASY